MRRLMIISAAVAAALLTATPAQAANVHFKGGPRAEPSFTDLGEMLNARGELTGLGGGDVVVKLTATGQPTAVCTNPSGGTQPPGQNPAEVTLTGVDAIPASEIKNGNVAFDVTTAAPVSPVPGAPDCPNAQWTETITDVAFTSGTITDEQPAGSVVFTASCSISPASTDGAISSTAVTC